MRAFRLGGCNILLAIWRTRREVDRLAVVLAGAAAGYGGDRGRPVTGGAVRGRRRAVGLASEGRGEAGRPATASPPVNLSRLRRVTLAALSLSLLALVRRFSWPGPSGLARRRCALEAVEKVVTSQKGPLP